MMRAHLGDKLVHLHQLGVMGLFLTYTMSKAIWYGQYKVCLSYTAAIVAIWILLKLVLRVLELYKTTAAKVGSVPTSTKTSFFKAHPWKQCFLTITRTVNLPLKATKDCTIAEAFKPFATLASMLTKLLHMFLAAVENVTRNVTKHLLKQLHLPPTNTCRWLLLPWMFNKGDF